MQRSDAVQVALDKTLKDARHHSPSLPSNLIFPFLLNLCFCCRAAAAHTQMAVTPTRGNRSVNGKCEKSTSVTTGSPGSALLKEIKRVKLLPVSYAFEGLQALSAAEVEINQLEKNGGPALENLWSEAAAGAQTLSFAELQKWLGKAFPVLNLPQPLHAALRRTILSDKDKHALTPNVFLRFLKTLCLCCRLYIVVGPLASDGTKDDAGAAQRWVDYEAFCCDYLNNVERSVCVAGDRHTIEPGGNHRAAEQALRNSPTRSPLNHLGTAGAVDDADRHPGQLSRCFREFELEFGLEELLVMACNSSACSVVTTALARHVKVCVEQGAVASVCHSAWQRLQDFKAVMQLLRQSLVEGEAISLESALRPLLQQVCWCFFNVVHSYCPAFCT
jgi:hypothetical protein